MHDALPKLLAYKIDEDAGEILMTNDGMNLDAWSQRLTSFKERVPFAFAMLEQVIKALKLLHSFGYSHGDFKPDNICARIDGEGITPGRTKGSGNGYRFTLIDLGMASKLPRLGEST